jgi:hypothetical protein
MWKNELFANSGEGVRPSLASGCARPLGCHLRRARSATRTKSVPAIVGGSRKSAGPVDESATGSAKLWSDKVRGHGLGPRPRAADSPKVLRTFRDERLTAVDANSPQLACGWGNSADV